RRFGRRQETQVRPTGQLKHSSSDSRRTSRICGIFMPTNIGSTPQLSADTHGEVLRIRLLVCGTQSCERVPAKLIARHSRCWRCVITTVPYMTRSLNLMLPSESRLDPAGNRGDSNNLCIDPGIPPMTSNTSEQSLMVKP